MKVRVMLLKEVQKVPIRAIQHLRDRRVNHILLPRGQVAVKVIQNLQAQVEVPDQAVVPVEQEVQVVAEAGVKDNELV
jgi:hypothetical protein